MSFCRVHIYIYVYTHKHRERERERERYIYIHVYEDTMPLTLRESCIRLPRKLMINLGRLYQTLNP